MRRAPASGYSCARSRTARRRSSSPPIDRERRLVDIASAHGEELALFPADVALEQVRERDELRAHSPAAPGGPPRAGASARRARPRAASCRSAEMPAEELLLGAGVRPEELLLEAAGEARSPGRSFGAPARLRVSREALLELERDEERLVVLAREGLQLRGTRFMMDRRGGTVAPRRPSPGASRVDPAGGLTRVDALRHGPTSTPSSRPILESTGALHGQQRNPFARPPRRDRRRPSHALREGRRRTSRTSPRWSSARCVVNELVARSGIAPKEFDAVVFGQVIPSPIVSLIAREMVLPHAAAEERRGAHRGARLRDLHPGDHRRRRPDRARPRRRA